MIKYIKGLLFVFITFLLLESVFPQQYFVKTYTVEDSLPTRFVLDITQDNTGLMWFATYSGISNYDGFSFANYNSKDGLADHNYRRLKFDNNGVLWALPFYTSDTICYLKDNRWIKIKTINDSSEFIETTNFDLISKDGKTVLCVGSANGIYIYENDEWKNFKLSEKAEHNTAFSVLAKDGKFIISGTFGLCVYENGKLDYSLTGNLKNVDKKVRALFLENAGNQNKKLWLLGYNWFGYLDGNNLNIVKQDFSIPILPYFNNSFIITDKVDNIIIGNGWAKFIYDRQTDELKPLQIRNGFSSNGAVSAFKDIEGNIWFADTRGIDKINNLDLVNYFELNGLLENEVTAVIEMNDGGFVFGHNNGLTIYKGNKFRKIPFDGNSANSSRVLDIMKDKDGYIWFTANQRGVGRLDADGNIKWHFLNMQFFVSSVFQDNNGRIWIGAMNNLYYIENGNVVHFKYNQNLKNTCRKIFPCESGGFYIGGVHGLWHINGDNVNMIPSDDEKSENIYSFLRTKNGEELIGTMHGLYKIENGRIVKFKKNGYSCDFPVYFILEDYNGHFWFGTNDGAYHWEGGKDALKYSPRNGLSGRETNRAAGYIDSKDRVWIGTDKGLSRFSKTYTDYKIPVPTVDLLSIQDSRGNLFNLKNDNPIDYSNNSLNFNFRAKSYMNEDMLTYEYKLEGFDSEWKSVRQPLIDAVQYLNVPPGDYKFLVKAKNFSGEWSDVVTSGEITIHSPFYKSFWFALFVLLLFSGMIMSFVMIKIQRNQTKKLVKEIQVREQIENDLIESKQKYKDIVDLLPEAIYETDLDGKFTFVNNYGLNLFNYTAEDVKNGISAYDVLEQSFIDDLDKNRIKVINNESISRVEYTGITKDGRRIPVSVNATPIHKDGKVVGIRGIAVDTTEQKNTEEVLRKFARDMESLNASKDKFFSIVAHDLKNPFQGLLGFSEFLHTEFHALTDEEKREYIGYIRTTSKNAYSLLENLLQWSRLQTGRIDVKPSDVNVYSEVNSVYELLTPNLLRKKISFQNKVEKNIAVNADRNMFASVLQNIITNAIKFTNPDGEITVTSKTEYGEALISIRDNGVGIKEDFQKKLFKIEYSNSNTGTHDESGTGLGLLLTKEMVELNGGRIFVESVFGKGSTFSFTLPLAINRG